MATSRGTLNPITVVDGNDLPWQSAGKPGLALKPVRADQERGRFFGLVGFEPMTRSGLHQHQGVATSFVLDGSLHDYQGAVGLHEAGINLKGATHDAVAYQRTMLVSRLEAPVTYPAQVVPVHQLHTGAYTTSTFANPNPLLPPDLNVAVDAVPARATGIARVTRQTIFDYQTTGCASEGVSRFVQLRLWPGAVVPRFMTTAPVDCWVRGGELHANEQRAHANCFVMIAAHTTVMLSAPFGALLLIWADGPITLMDKPFRSGKLKMPNPFGF